MQSPIIKRGLALTPVKFGISFTAKHLNQAGALLHVYTDGSVMINHGGTEMGQGLHTKVCQVVARELGLDLERVRISATRTDKVPNTSPTAASSGADLNGQAARDAAPSCASGCSTLPWTHSIGRRRARPRDHAPGRRHAGGRHRREPSGAFPGASWSRRPTSAGSRSPRRASTPRR